METIEQIKKFKEFIEEHEELRVQLIENIKKDNKFLLINHADLAAFEPDLTDDLLESPEETIKAAEIAIEQFDSLGNIKGFRARFYNLPKTSRMHPKDILSKHVGKFIGLVGNVSKTTPVLHFASSAKFECMSCGNVLNVLYTERKFRVPDKCGCGAKGKFRMIDKEIVDTIKLFISDDLQDEDNKNSQVAREKLAVLENDIAANEKDKLSKTGKKVVANGFFKYEQKDIKSTEYIATFYVNSIEVIEIGWDIVKITKQEEEEIKQLAKKDDIILRLARSISDFQGHDEVLTSNILQLTGAPNIYDNNHLLNFRGTIHILTVGDPGVNKTQNAKQVVDISPIGAFYSAANASGKGLVVAVVKDADLGCYVMIPGVVVQCHLGIVVIDELDKTHPDDYGDHNHAMSEGVVPVAKGDVKGRLDAETSYLGLANPKYRTFQTVGDDSKLDQINMPKDLLDRFDIIWALESETKKDKIGGIIDIMMDRHLDDEEKKNNKWKPEFTHEFIRKYIAYCRRNNPRPKLKRVMIQVIKSKLFELMKPRADEQIKISNREVEKITRLSYASARLRLRDMTEQDIELAFKLKKESFQQLGILTEQGYNWAVEERIDFSEISNVDAVKLAFKELEKKVGKLVPIDDIICLCKEKNIEEEDVENTINKLKKAGDYFEPRNGFISKF